MAEKTNLIVQHSGGILVVDPKAFGTLDIDPAPGTRIVHKANYLETLGLGYGLFRVEYVGGASYRVVSEISDMVFDVAGASQAAGAPIILWPWHGGPNQRFRITKPPVSNQVWGFFLEAMHSGKVLDVFRASGETGAPLVQWDYHGGPNQLFRVFGNPIKPVYSDLVLDVEHGSHANGAPIILWPRHGGLNQLFRLERVRVVVPSKTVDAYRIVADHSGKVLDVEGASHEDGAKIIQWEWHGGLNQVFGIRGWGNGFLLWSQHTASYLTVVRASQGPGAQLSQWRQPSEPNQVFKL